MTERGAARAVPRDVMRRPLSSALGLAAAAATLACEQPPLGARDVAANAVWVVSGLLFCLLVVFLVVEVLDWLRGAWRRLRGLDPPPGPFQPGDTVHLSRAERRPLRRVRWRPHIARRTWNDVNPSADADCER
jgi:hypothetical protein